MRGSSSGDKGSGDGGGDGHGDYVKEGEDDEVRVRGVVDGADGGCGGSADVRRWRWRR